MNDYGYKRYWAQDVLTELGHNYLDINAVAWILRWMTRNFLEPEEESVTSMADACKENFFLYIQKRTKNLK
jgi:hypothetical protein